MSTARDDGRNVLVCHMLGLLNIWCEFLNSSTYQSWTCQKRMQAREF
jgi:hypothetical protein